MNGPAPTSGSTRRRVRLPLLLPALVLLLAGDGIESPLSAQGSRAVDSGRFRITREGREIGTEVFAIRREASSLLSVARLTTGRDTSVLSDRIIEARLQTDEQDEPRFFELEVQMGGDLNLVGVRSGSRFRLRTRTSEGERWKEFLVPSGLVILPRGFVHFHHFIFRQRTRGERLTALLPMEGTERPVRIGGERATVGAERRLVWRSEDGRILRVEIPAENWVAVRTPGNGPSGTGGPAGGPSESQP